MKKSVKYAFIVGILFTTLGFIGFVGMLINKVLAGEGLDYYFTGFGYKFSYLGVLILVTLAPIVLGGAFAYQWWPEKDERDFIRKYVSGNSENDDT